MEKMRIRPIFMLMGPCASWINVNNCPTRCDYTQFIIFL